MKNQSQLIPQLYHKFMKILNCSKKRKTCDNKTQNQKAFVITGTKLRSER